MKLICSRVNCFDCKFSLFLWGCIVLGRILAVAFYKMLFWIPHKATGITVAGETNFTHSDLYLCSSFLLFSF